jgi:class 3 adenylate cyclase/tetratricopeptide (TPR) repeat protein
VNTSGERRTVTLAFADLSAYTAMNDALDPEDVFEALGEIHETARHVAEQYGGIVNQVVGDEVVMIFGMPLAYGNDPVRAVEAAMSLHERVDELGRRMEGQLGRRLQMHSGVYTGSVLFSPGDDRSGLYQITGDAVNIAAWLRSQAASGEILIGPETFATAGAFFETEATEPLSVKGKGRTMIAHRVLARGAHHSRFAVARSKGLLKQVGRDAQFDQVCECIERATRGETLSLAIVGESGVGKSRLLHSAIGHAAERGMKLLTGRCESYGNVPPYQVLLDVLRALFELDRDESAAESAERVTRFIESNAPEQSRAAPLFLNMLSLPQDGHSPPNESGAALQEAFLDALCGLLSAVARKQSIALGLEDLHWADDRSDLALQRLLDALDGTGAVILLTYRPEPRPQWEPRIGTVVELTPLGRDETAALACAALRVESLSDELAEFLYSRTAGNPLFIEEFTRSLRDHEIVPVESGVASLVQHESAEALPTNVDSIIRGRVDRLPERDREVLSMASVVGSEFSSAILESIVDESGALLGCLGRLERAGLIRRSESMGCYAFSHIVVHQVVYESLLRRRRRDVHARVAESIEASVDSDRLPEHYETLARHYGTAQHLDKADHYSEKAGDKAALAHSLEQAAGHYQRSVGFLDAMPESDEQRHRRIAMTLKWGRASIYRPTDTGIRALQTSVESARVLGDQNAVGKALYWLAWSQYTRGDHLEAIASLERCIEAAISHGNLRLEAQANANLAYCHAARRDFDKALARLHRGRELEVKGKHALFGDAYLSGYFGMIYGDRGEFDLAFQHLDDAVRGATELDELPAMGSVLTQVAIVEAQSGHWEKTIETAAELRSIGERIESSYLVAMSETLEGYAISYLGTDPDRAIALMTSAVKTLETQGLKLTMSFNYGCLAEALAIAGHASHAVEVARNALDPDHVGDRMGDVMSHRAMAIAAVRCDEPDVGAFEQHLARAEVAEQGVGLPREAALTRYWRAVLYADLGDTDRARAEAEPALAALRELGLDWYASHLTERLDEA